MALKPTPPKRQAGIEPCSSLPTSDQDQKALPATGENEHCPPLENPMGVTATTGLFSGGTALHPAVGKDRIPEVKEVRTGCRIDCRNELHGLGHTPLLPAR